jgi:nucleotide-binding universal stress UspA family protein
MKFGATLLLLQVITPIYHMESLESAGYVQIMLDAAKRMENKAEVYLETVKTNLKNDGVDAVVQVAQGEPVERILAAAEEGEVDLIAMSSHGRTGLPRVLFGSVAAGVLHNTGRPLLLIRAEDSSRTD